MLSGNLDKFPLHCIQVEAALKRATKGAPLTAGQILACARLSEGGIRLQRAVNSTAKQFQETGPQSQLQPILKAVKVVPSLYQGLTAGCGKDVGIT